MSPPLLVYLCPLLLAFEGAQLVIGERYLGIKQIERSIDPRTQPMSEAIAFLWSAGIGFNWLWMLAILWSNFGQGQIACMLVVSLLGYTVRRNCVLKYILVVLTLEGAIRIGMHISLLALAWRAL